MYNIYAHIRLAYVTVVLVQCNELIGPEEFSIEIPDSEADKILSIADAVAYVSGHPMAK